MRRCIQLAKNGLGTTYPNPLVGSVIVHNNSIIGEGWHYQAGLPHAEVYAIKSVIDKTTLNEATIYVNLEPCSHFGKTPPCADLIISSGIKKVVIGNTDPNPKVSGSGIEKLKQAGCEVIVGVLEAACQDLNKRFFTFQRQQRPYIFLKWAQTKDGFISPTERDSAKKPVWITTPASRQLVHKMRAEEQAILVGTNTVIDDNPSLTTRDWMGSSPMRLVLDRTLQVRKDAAVYDGTAHTIVLTEKEVENSQKVTFEKIDFKSDLTTQICDILFKNKIQSLIVEGGAQLLQTFIDSNSWDEAVVFTGKTTFEHGIAAPKLAQQFVYSEKIKTDMVAHYKNTNY